VWLCFPKVPVPSVHETPRNPQSASSVCPRNPTKPVSTKPGNPDVSRAEVIQATGGGNGVHSRIALFGGGRVAGTGTIAAASGLPTPALLTQWLSLPASVTNHAHIHRAYFDNFATSTKPAWFKRETIIKEVEDWMRATYKKTYNEMDVFAQHAEDAGGAMRRNVHLMYRALPEENDAFGVEELINQDLTMRIGHPNDLNVARTDARFNV
jgi:hypothetical protein